MQSLLKIEFDLTDIALTAQKFARVLLAERSTPFIVGYDAEMGCGKTTFSRALLYELGLDRGEPVLSPTFTYIHEYRVGPHLFGHLDLYRLNGEIDLEELTGRSLDDFRGLLIEWPDNGGGVRHLGCQYLIKGLTVSDERRLFELFKLG